VGDILFVCCETMQLYLTDMRVLLRSLINNQSPGNSPQDSKYPYVQIDYAVGMRFSVSWCNTLYCQLSDAKVGSRSF